MVTIQEYEKRVAQKPLCWAEGSSQTAHGESQVSRVAKKRRN